MPATTLDRNACERRVYRLATLLTGNPNAATKVIKAVIGAQPDLRKLDGAHIDRLTVLRSREIKPSRIVSDHVPAEMAAVLAELPSQQREAWVFKHVYRLPPREMARAMDCSARAIDQHLSNAEGFVNGQVGAARSDLMARALLTYTMQLDVPEFYRAQVKRTMMWKLLKRIIKLLILIAIVIGCVLAVEHFGLFDALLQSGSELTSNEVGS